MLSPAASRGDLGPLSGAPEEVGSLHWLDSFKAYQRWHTGRAFCL